MESEGKSNVVRLSGVFGMRGVVLCKSRYVEIRMVSV